MPAHRPILTLSAITGIVLLSATAAQAADPTGVWMNDTGRGAIEIKNCGGGLCGHVVWVKDTTDTKGCGRQIIGNAAKVGANVWDNGWIYNPDKKKKYDVELKPLSNGTLQVTGYAGSKIFSKTMIWKRAPANLVRCGSEQTVAKVDPKIKPDTAKAEPKAKPESVAKSEAKTAAKKDVAVVKPETKIVPPAPKPAERPAKKPAHTAPETPVEVARAEPAPAPAAKSEPASETAPATEEAPQVHALPGVEDEKDAPVVVAADEEEADEPGIDMGNIAKRLAELERETGYGLKRSGNGNCRLKVPYATVNFPCRD
ncbi:MAG: hypothetical protein B7Y80_08540 [Hyphomicrobium sp. 32-62-53]|nr:MAG: hypothetical protein B7Z29_16490 [Hyphomicrobium sp. 12-62-95]OYY00175.1 MAG: hypothetical protein B7Y80_08540 [Hyphomicrobium sp. 32-62-53]